MPRAKPGSAAASRRHAASRVVLLLLSAEYSTATLIGLENVTFLSASAEPLDGAGEWPALAAFAENACLLYVAVVRDNDDVEAALEEADSLDVSLLVMAPRHANSSASGVANAADVVAWLDDGHNSQTALLVLTAVEAGYTRLHLHACNTALSFDTLFAAKALRRRLQKLSGGFVLTGFVKEVVVMSAVLTESDKYLVGGCLVSGDAVPSVSVLRVAVGECRVYSLGPRIYAPPRSWEVVSIDRHEYDADSGIYHFYVTWAGYESEASSMVALLPIKDSPVLLRAYCKAEGLSFDVVCKNS